MTASTTTVASDTNVQYFLLEELAESTDASSAAVATVTQFAFPSHDRYKPDGGTSSTNESTMIMLAEQVSSSSSSTSLYCNISVNETDNGFRRIYLEDHLALPFISSQDADLTSSRGVRQEEDLHELQSPLLPLDASERSDSRRTGSRSRRRSRVVSNHHRITELSGLNYLNVMTYLVHLVVWWGVAVWGIDALVNTQWEVTQDNETLVTPATWAANYLWVPILVTEAAFTIAQLLPHFRTRSIVTNGTGYFFFYTVLLQIAYTFLYSFGLFIFSFIAALLALLALLSLLASQQRHESGASQYVPPRGSRGSSVLEYVLFQFPFYLHAGWMILMAVDHFSVLVRHYATDNVGLQLAADIVALALLLSVATNSLNQQAGPDFVIPVVMLWSFIGIACRLQDPGSAMMLAYGPVVIQAILISTYLMIGIVAFCMIPFIVICLAREFCTINVIELD